MKSKRIIQITIGALALLLIISLIWGIGANNRINKLQADYNISLGKNMIYEIEAQALKDSIAKINTSYTLLQKYNDSVVRVYNKKVSDRDAIIAKYKKEHSTVASLSAMKSFNYFNEKIGSDNPPIIVSVSPDTSFSIPTTDIRCANFLFIQRDELKETNYNLKQSEQTLLTLNKGLSLEISNRQSAIDKLMQLVNNKDNQINEYQNQIKDIEKINKKQHRKDTIHKIGIGAAGAIAVIVALTL